jgi:hypothetical protein
MSRPQSHRSAPRFIRYPDTGVDHFDLNESALRRVARYARRPACDSGSQNQAALLESTFNGIPYVEIIVARAVFRRRVLHALRHATISTAVISLLRVLLSILAVTRVLVREATRRIAHQQTSLQIKLLQINHR